jgi:hypothetical protein
MYKQVGPIWRWSTSRRTEISDKEEVWPATVVRKISGGGGHGGWEEREETLVSVVSLLENYFNKK